MSKKSYCIQQLRKEREITQKELACKAKVSLSHLRGIEQGVKTPSVRTLARIAKVLNVSIKDLERSE